MAAKIVIPLFLLLSILTGFLLVNAALSSCLVYIEGDLDRNGVVDKEDLIIAANAFGTYPTHGRWNSAVDLNQDGMVDGLDIIIVAHNLGKKANPVHANVNVKPEALNLRSEGKWITVHIESTECYNVTDIDISTLMLNNTIPSESHPVAVEDEDNDGMTDLMVKFSRQAVIALILSNYQSTERFGNVTLTITGEFNDGPSFSGSDTVKTISKP